MFSYPIPPILINMLSTKLQHKSLAAGGYNNVGGFLSSAEFYTPDENQWRPISSMRAARRGLAMITYRRQSLLVFGGTSNGRESLTSVEKYDPVTDVWTVLPTVMPTAREGHSVVLEPGF